MRTITQEEIKRFWTDGVVYLPNVLNTNELAWLSEGLRESVPIMPSTAAYYDLTALGDNIAGQGATLLRDKSIETKNNRGHFTVAVGLWMLVPAIRRVIFESCLPHVAAALMKSHKVNLYDDQVLIKPPRTADHTAFHQDQSYFHIDGNKACVMWVSPDLITPEMGPMQYVRGSHQWGPTYKPNIFVTRGYIYDADGADMPDIEAQREHYDIVTYATRPGDIIVHHYKTLHGSGGNASHDQMRRALSVRYCGDDVTYRFRPSAPPQPHHRHTLRDGDPVDSDQFPVVWQEQ